MSNIGLNNNTFRVTGKYFDILNEFIVKTKVNPEINETKKEQLLDFIIKINDVNNFDPQYQLLSSIIERELRQERLNPNVFFTNLLNEIRNEDLEAALPKIILIAEALDSENSEALLKIKGK